MSLAIKALVLATFYPSENGKEAHRFVHVRNLYYQEQGIDVTVLCFGTKEDYVYENIRVISLKTYKRQKEEYDLLISHQANIRNHYLFLKKYSKRFPHIVFFFHGHEVLRFSKTYPKPYDYVTNSSLKVMARDVYDCFKLFIWKKYIPRLIDKSKLVFVSKWMLEEFLKATKLQFSDIDGHYEITYNGVGKAFQENEYNSKIDKQYDFVTIRSNLDGSKYCIDVVNELARNNSQYKFLVVGKGEFFSHNVKADNITWCDKTMNHDEIIKTLQTARCALMPTRTDAQGLMMCEMATFGMPVITSDLPVCHEALDGFANVAMISNEVFNCDLGEICEKLESGMPYVKDERYFSENTSAHEVCIFNSIMSERND
ncbi:MAG: glycosyltransferase family 4 protein [Lachnospiraceae bacterium]|nr:glycosyltransferase family 4 protein [Lachnospiraceae bacterium]